MSNLKLVKVDNWGIYFLQRLKNFFNRTDYCDLTLQFQDKAQLKVHRLVLSACTEYFEVLERTCEMYDDCLVMPEDLQADVVVPIINFMYTGQLEFSMDLLERLYQTSVIMNLPILTKLLNSHRSTGPPRTPQLAYNVTPKKYSKQSDVTKLKKTVNNPVVPVNNKRTFKKAFNTSTSPEDNSIYNKPNKIVSNDLYFNPSASAPKRPAKYNPRPTRYELPEELDSDNIFEDNSFSKISYTSQPLMVHPEAVKRYSKHHKGDPSTSKRLGNETSTLDIVECKKISNDNIFDDNLSESMNDDSFPSTYVKQQVRDTNELFDQIIEQNARPKLTIENKNPKVSSNLDHAKIISEVLKRYPHLMNSNKNIKLKVLNTPTKVKKEPQFEDNYKTIKLEKEKPDDYTFESDVIDSKQAARLIAMGAENVKGPWICLICGTPGKALHFTSYYKFRCHLVNVHKEKPVSNICEYCGLKSLKRNYMLHHMYSQHGVPPPPQYKFPKCNQCNYIALTDNYLSKHKLTHIDPKKFRCNVCSRTYNTSQELLTHIRGTGHKFTPDKRTNLQCVYCLKVFLRDYNLYTHLKTHHKQEAKEDEIIEDSEEENIEETVRERNNKIIVKYEEPTNLQPEFEVQYEIQENPGGNIEIISKKQSSKQKILNSGFTNQKQVLANQTSLSNIDEENYDDPEEMVLIDNVEYVVKNSHLITKNQKDCSQDYNISEILVNSAEPEPNVQSVVSSPSLKFTNITNAHLEENTSQRVVINKPSTINTPIQIVVSNEEEYKALMSANHPFIFDNSDSSKTLTVLTTANTSTLNNTSISMATTSTDMVVIPENYPLNVSDAVTGNNSNIVVVYSHPVDTQNKQYQLVTTAQELETQFIQSPAIISQNYATVTSNTAVMSTHVLESSETWQNNNIPEAINVQEAPTIEVHTNSNIIETNIMPTEERNDPDLTDLPEVVLSQQTSDAVSFNLPQEKLVDSSQVVENVSEITEIDISKPAISQEPVQLSENDTTKDQLTTEKEQIIESEVASESYVTVPEQVLDEIKNVDEKITNTEETEHNIEPNLTHDELDVSLPEESQVLVETSQEVPEEGTSQELAYVSSPTYTQEETHVEEVVAAPSVPDAQDTEKHVQSEVDVSTIEKKSIENIASEWSEDEYDEVIVKANEKCPDVNNSIQNEIIKVETPGEIEESIENIQIEVNSMSDSRSLNDDALTQDESITEVEETKSLEKNKADIPTEESLIKISSLLNDWEDNDSQEEVTANEAENTQKQLIEKESDGGSEISAAQPVADKTENSKSSEKAPDSNIKNLVSDWDDDEDE